jgi:4a-hydroxytetrahydrobiopterin dehydratase
MSELAMRICKPCSGDVPPLQGVPLRKLHDELNNNWQVIESHHLEKEYTFLDFRTALDFTNRVGELAEEVWHHPDLYLAWGKVKVTIYTHVIDGLSETDFILAAKIDQLQ